MDYINKHTHIGNGLSARVFAMEEKQLYKYSGDKSLMRTFIWISFLLLLSSCSIFDGNETSQIELKRSWEVVEFFDAEGDKIVLNQNEPLTLRFSGENKLNGEADCNVFGGEYYAKENGDLNIKNLIYTEIACQQPTLGQDYLNALTRVSDFEKDEGKLILFYGEDGKIIFLERLE